MTIAPLDFLRPVTLARRLRLLSVLVLSPLLAHCTASNHNAYGLTSIGTIVEFQTDTPTTITTEETVTQASTSGTLTQIAYRPADGNLYGITTDNYLVEVDPTTGVSTYVGTAAFTAESLSNAIISFDPVNDQLRVIDANHNLRVSPTDGTLLATGTKVAYASGDSAAADTPSLVGLSYDNATVGSSATTLYGLDSGTGDLVRVGNENASVATVADAGTLTTIGTTGVSFSGSAGFDVAASDGVGYAILSASASASSLYTVDLDTGLATDVGFIGAANRTLVSLAIVP